MTLVTDAHMRHRFQYNNSFITIILHNLIHKHVFNITSTMCLCLCVFWAKICIQEDACVEINVTPNTAWIQQCFYHMQNGATYEFLSQLLNKIIITCTHAHTCQHIPCSTVIVGRRCTEQHIHRDILKAYTNANVHSRFCWCWSCRRCCCCYYNVYHWCFSRVCRCSSCCRHHRTNRRVNRVWAKEVLHSLLSRSILNTHSEKLKQENFCPNNTKPNVRNGCGPQSWYLGA